MDLTQRAPRSPRVRLGGYAHLPRLLDKARASVAGKLGEYSYPCPVDQLFFDFTGVTPEQVVELVKAGHGDGAVLEWVRENAPLKRQDWEVQAWSASLEQRGPGSADMHGWVAGLLGKTGPQRDDIRTFFELLDFDDYVSFGGKP
jgi:hypothetical protein